MGQGPCLWEAEASLGAPEAATISHHPLPFFAIFPSPSDSASGGAGVSLLPWLPFLMVCAALSGCVSYMELSWFLSKLSTGRPLHGHHFVTVGAPCAAPQGLVAALGWGS